MTREAREQIYFQLGKLDEIRKMGGFPANAGKTVNEAVETIKKAMDDDRYTETHIRRLETIIEDLGGCTVAGNEECASYQKAN